MTCWHSRVLSAALVGVGIFSATAEAQTPPPATGTIPATAAPGPAAAPPATATPPAIATPPAAAAVPPAAAAPPAAAMPAAAFPGANEVKPPSADVGGGDANGPGSFRSPYGAVTAFLNALQSKDAEKLKEATALRAPTESVGKNQKMFTSILDGSMSEDELSELSQKMEGYKIVGHNDARSSGRLGVTLGKMGTKGESYKRTVTVRHEKDGWKVVDISGVGKFEKPMVMPRFGVRRR